MIVLGDEITEKGRKGWKFLQQTHFSLCRYWKLPCS